MAPISHHPSIGEVLTYRPGGIYSPTTIEVRIQKVWAAVCEVEATSGQPLKYQKPGRGLRVPVGLLYK